METSLCFSIDKGLMPEWLKSVLDTTDNEIEKDFLLMASLTCVSACLPGVYFKHEGTSKYPHLMTAIIAPPSSGKSIINKITKMVDRLDSWVNQQESSQPKMKDGKPLGFARGLNIADCLTDAALMANLDTNKGAGIVTTSELSSLFTSMTDDYGTQLCDHILKAAENETLKSQRAGDYTKFQISEARLAICGTSVPGHLHTIFGDASFSKGLASRWLVYLSNAVQPRDSSRALEQDEEGGLSNSERLLLKASEQLTQLFQILWQRAESGGKIRIRMDKESILAYEAIITPVEEEMKNCEQADQMAPFLSVCHRLQLHTKRIACVLQMLEMIEQTEFPDLIEIDPRCYKLASQITWWIFIEEKTLYERRFCTKITPAATPLLESKEMQEAWSKLPEEFTYEALYYALKAKQAVYGFQAGEVKNRLLYKNGTADSYLDAWLNAGKLNKTGAAPNVIYKKKGVSFH